MDNLVKLGIIKSWCFAIKGTGIDISKIEKIRKDYRELTYQEFVDYNVYYEISDYPLEQN